MYLHILVLCYYVLHVPHSAPTTGASKAAAHDESHHVLRAEDNWAYIAAEVQLGMWHTGVLNVIGDWRIILLAELVALHAFFIVRLMAKTR